MDILTAMYNGFSVISEYRHGAHSDVKSSRLVTRLATTARTPVSGALREEF